MSNVFVFVGVVRQHLKALIPHGEHIETHQWFDKVATNYVVGVLKREFGSWAAGSIPFHITEEEAACLYHEAADLARKAGDVLVAPTQSYMEGAWGGFVRVALHAVRDMVQQGRPVMGLSAPDAFRIGKKLQEAAVKREAKELAAAGTHHVYWHENLEIVALTSSAALAQAGYDLLNCLRPEAIGYNYHRLRDAPHTSFIAVRRHGKIISLAEVTIIKYSYDYVPADADGWRVEITSHVGLSNDPPDSDASHALRAWISSTFGTKSWMPMNGLSEYYAWRDGEFAVQQVSDRRRPRPHMLVRACRGQPPVERMTTPSFPYRSTLDVIAEGAFVFDSLGLFSGGTGPFVIELKIDSYRTPDAVLEAPPVAHNIGQRGRRATDELQSRFGSQKQRVVLAKAREYTYPLPKMHPLAVDVYKEHDRAFLQRRGSNYAGGGSASLPPSGPRLFPASVVEAVDRVREQVAQYLGQTFDAVQRGVVETTRLREFMSRWVESVRTLRGVPESPVRIVGDEHQQAPLRTGWVLTETQRPVIPNPRRPAVVIHDEVNTMRHTRRGPPDGWAFEYRDPVMLDAIRQPIEIEVNVRDDPAPPAS